MVLVDHHHTGSVDTEKRRQHSTNRSASDDQHVNLDVAAAPRHPNLAEDFEKLKLRAVSLFEHMSEEVLEAGFASIEAVLPLLDDGPQYETSELLVFQRKQGRSVRLSARGPCSQALAAVRSGSSHGGRSRSRSPPAAAPQGEPR
nr:hypothetical protein [Micromonospora cremea]